MKKHFKHGFLSLGICFMLLFNSFSIYAVTTENETVYTADTSIEAGTDENEADSTEANDGIVVEGLEGEIIKEVADIVLSKARSSCGFNHMWSVTRVIQEPACDKEGVYRVQCSICGATGTVYTDAPGHNYVKGICSVCGEKQEVEVAPDGELAKWEYELNDMDKTITLKKYIGEEADVIVYGSYMVDEAVYNTILNGDSTMTTYQNRPFYDKRFLLTSIIIKPGVVSNDCTGLFSYCQILQNVDINNLDTSQSTSMEYMFFDCYKLKTLDVSGLDTSKVTTMRGMFSTCLELESLDLSSFDTSNVTTFVGMFNNCNNLRSINLNNFNTEKTVNMNSMFSNCLKLESLDLSSFNTTNVSSMYMMFMSCETLSTLDLSNFDTENVIDMAFLFHDCPNLKYLNMESFNTSNVIVMISMFGYCKELEEINIAHFDTSNVENMSDMFTNCTKLNNLNLQNFDTSKVTDMSNMFSWCTSLTNLDLSSFQTYNVNNMNYMFKNCTNLASIYVNRMKWNTTFATTYEMFQDCRTSNVTVK